MKQDVTISFERFNHWNELSKNDQELVERANAVSKTAYAPYSKFHVGASLRLSNDEIVTGSNQENIAYPSGLCAERVALFYTGANFPDEQIETLCVVAEGDLLPVDKILSPCGACRQVMLETEVRQKKSYRIILVSQNGVTIVFNSAVDLLPLAFGITD
ncbi:MAG: cytidine deaminase [Crocinitomicaceae bacterium]|nr:cytidine deaminase [Crocinitomicaceae bacterium]